MSFIDFPNPTPVFPTLKPLSWSVFKTLSMSSRVTTAASGRENQLACAVFPRWEFKLSYGGSSWLRDQTQNIVPDPTKLGQTEFEQLSGLYLSCLGSYGEFYYSDPDDSSRANQFVGIFNGAVHQFPLIFNWGNGPFTPSFFSPIGGINVLSTVYTNGIPVNPSFYTLDATRTILIFTTDPNPGIITADFSFYYRCRFLEDNLEFSQWALNLWETREVKFKSVKP